MFTLIVSQPGIDVNRVINMWESTFRCKYSPKKTKRYHSDFDITGVDKTWPIQFDFTITNDELHHRNIKNAKFVIIPIRPDIAWDSYESCYKSPASAYCNRLRRLYEISASYKNCITIPYHKLFQSDGAKSICDFLNLVKPMNYIQDEMLCPWPNCEILLRYKKFEEQIMKTKSYFTNWIDK